MEDNGDDVGSKLSRKGNADAGVGAKRGVHDNTPLPRVMPSQPSLLVERARGLGVSGMELLHDSWHIPQVRRILPTVVFWAPTLPVHEVLQLLPPPVPPRIQHLLYFILFFTFYLN